MMDSRVLRPTGAMLRRLAGVLLLLAPRTAVAAISAGPQIEVPWLHDVEDFRQATVAVLADGSFAIAGTETLQPDPQQPSFLTIRLQAQFFRANGAAATQPRVLIQFPGEVTFAGVGSLGDRYLVTWQDSKRAHADLYSPDGLLLDEISPWPYSDVPLFAEFYRFGSAPRWRFLPITYRQAGLDAHGDPFYRIFLQVAAPSGALLGPPVELAPQRLVDIDDAAINGRGTFVVVSHQCSLVHPRLPCSNGMQLFDGAARPRTPLLTAAVPQDLGPGDTVNIASRVAMNPQGEVLLSWVAGHQNDLVRRLLVRLYDPHGSPLSDALQVTPATAPGPSQLRRGLKALDDGTYVISWLERSPTDETATLFVERFDPRTGRFEEPLAIPIGVDPVALVELDGAGRGVVVWQTRESVGSGRISRQGHLRVIHIHP
jgi:hypothetical protein